MEIKSIMISTLLSFFIFTLYVIYVWINYGILKSISDSYYHIKHKSLFTLSLWGFSVFALASVQNVWLFLSVIGICFVGAAPKFRMKFEGDVHYVAAMSGILFGGIALISLGFWYLSLLMITGIIILHFTVSNKTWWQEILAFYIIILGLFIYNT